MESEFSDWHQSHRLSFWMPILDHPANIVHHLITWSAPIEHKVKDREGMKTTLMCARKNQVSRRGHCANALVFGRENNMPDLLIISLSAAQTVQLIAHTKREANLECGSGRHATKDC